MRHRRTPISMASARPSIAPYGPHPDLGGAPDVVGGVDPGVSHRHRLGLRGFEVAAVLRADAPLGGGASHPENLDAVGSPMGSGDQGETALSAYYEAG